jgi:uncharacterized protein
MVTDRCNLQCRYCYQKSMEDTGIDSGFTVRCVNSSVFDVEVNRLKMFLEKDCNPVIIFYGGEPLLEIGVITGIMDGLDGMDIPFRIQTNGLLLDTLPKKYLNRIGKILVSLDGDKQRTDLNRGKGVFDRVMKNISVVKKWYTGEIVARMTIAQDCPDILEQVVYILKNFSSVHWQLDAGFYYSDFNEYIFSEFVKEYNKGISKLIRYWVNTMKTGNVLRLYPFLGVMHSLLFNEKSQLRCGAGHAGYCIGTDGVIVACPITNYMKDFVAGTVDMHPNDLKKFEVSGRCLECDIKHLCGGRCLYWNKGRLWPERGDDLICDTVHHLIKELQSVKPEIVSLIDNQIIKKSDFVYEKYFGPEIIP